MIETVVIAIIGSGALSTLISAVITAIANRKSRLTKIEGKLDDLDKKITAQGAKEDERAAVNHRVRILRFGDELLEGRRHSKDSYDQVLTDASAYLRYTESHPDFRNEITMATVEHIKKNYAERLEKHDFL